MRCNEMTTGRSPKDGAQRHFHFLLGFVAGILLVLLSHLLSQQFWISSHYGKHTRFSSGRRLFYIVSGRRLFYIVSVHEVVMSSYLLLNLQLPSRQQNGSKINRKMTKQVSTCVVTNVQYLLAPVILFQRNEANRGGVQQRIPRRWCATRRAGSPNPAKPTGTSACTAHPCRCPSSRRRRPGRRSTAASGGSGRTRARAWTTSRRPR
jgi:hypothetical protein